MKIIKILLISIIGVNLCYSAQPLNLAQDAKKKEANPFGYTQDRQKVNKRLIDATRAGDITTVQQLLNDKSIDINTRDEYGNTALLWASARGYKEIVKLLLNHPDIDINIQDKKGRNALMWATEKNHKEIVKLLLNHPDIDINIQDHIGFTALATATVHSYEEIVKLLLNHPKINVNIQNNKGFTALIWASRLNQKEIVELLLNHPAIDVNIQDIDGRNALSWASRNKEIIELLQTFKDVYLPYKNKRIEELKKERITYIDKATKKTQIPLPVLNIINEYAGQDFDKKDIENNILTFSQFLEQNQKKESTNKEDNAKN